VCRSLRVLCAAGTDQRLQELRRAAVGAHWELVGGALSVEALGEQVAEWRPDVVVVDAALGQEAAAVARRARRTVRVVSVGTLAGADAQADSVDGVRQAILGLPRPGGPVRA
jgi:AmiR/NasT family two-component response regulator